MKFQSARRPAGAAPFEIERRPKRRLRLQAPNREGRDGFKRIAAAGVNARFPGRGPLLRTARDPLDFGAHQPLDDPRQVVVEPLLEHRTQHLAHQFVGEFRAAHRKIG